MADWSIDKSLQTYNISRWGEGYFDISASGHLTVCAADDKPPIDLKQVVQMAQKSGLSLPLLARFPAILHKRVEALCRVFDQALDIHAPNGQYSPIYPIKVNQNHNVVKELLKASGDRLGLEAGSKPELLTVLALSQANGKIVCNGYKDQEYIRLALAGLRIGMRVYIVIEKLSELTLVINECQSSGITPRLGMRIKLASIASGKWQSSGGERSKFGLTSSQVIQAAEQLRKASMLDSLELLHVHLGSQISNIRDIQNGLSEAVQFLVQLENMGGSIKIIDVGGGLGVDYEGTRSRSECSMNYPLSEYADKVVQTIARACEINHITMPEIFSESGRALTAHHAVLITDVTAVEKHIDKIPPAGDNNEPILEGLRDQLLSLQQDNPLREVYHNAVFYLQEIQLRFNQGLVTLHERAKAEELYYAICASLQAKIDFTNRSHLDLQHELNEILADKVFCNLSVFQSMPDVWAIDQVFPIVPLQRLDEEPTRRAILHDLTCDSDGRIDHYVNSQNIENTLPLHDMHPADRYLLGFFLVGAYQEALGDIHNLFGDTAKVNVVQDGEGNIKLENAFHGENVRHLLSRVEYDPEQIRQSIVDKAISCNLSEKERDKLMEELQASLQAYSYLVNQADDESFSLS